MTVKSSARFAVREATMGCHHRVDAAFAHFTLSDSGHYRAFLRAQADAFLPVEAGISRADLAQALPDWADRCRSEELIADLRSLGETVKPVVEAPVYDTLEAALGADYVLEGSRLGGRILARSVPENLPRRFLTTDNPALWRKLVEMLDERLVAQDQLAVAIEAARAVFARFETSARRHREDVCL